MKNKTILFIIFLSFYSNSSAQFYKKHENDKLKFYGTLDIRNSIVFEESLGFYGVKLGVGNKRVRFGIGYHELSKSVFRFFLEEDPFSPLKFDEKFFTYRHISAFVDPILYQTPRWELLLPIHVGIGPIKAYVYDTTGIERQVISKDFVPSFTVSIKANYRVFKWIGVTAGFGDNLVFLDNFSLIGNFINYLIYGYFHFL